MSDPGPPPAAAGRLRLADVLLRLVRPGTASAAYFGVLALGALLAKLTDDRLHGVSAPMVRQLVATRFRGEVLDAALLVLATALLLGIVLGTIAGWVIRGRDWLAGRAPRSARQLAGPALVLVAATHAVLWLVDLARHPQPYAETLYAQGGARAALQIVATDWLGVTGLWVVAAFGFAAWLLAPLRGALTSRLRGLSKRALRVPVAVLGVVAVGVLLVLVASGLGRASAAEPGGRPNVLLIAADSLRADRVEPRVAPGLAAFAGRGTRFEQAHVGLPRTFPSWVTLLTGNDPHRHGIRHMFPRWEARAVDHQAIPSRFARAGYRTSVVSDFAGDIFGRIDLGFRHARTPTFNARELIREQIFGSQGPLLPLLRSRTAVRALPVLRELHDTTDPRLVTQDALAEVDAASGSPFFVVAFYSTTHFPYPAPAPYWSRFADPAYRGPFRYGKTPSITGEKQPSAADVRHVRALYDGAVAAVDDALLELWAGLERRGLSKNTIVVVTSDHGESLYEPGRGQGHGDHLFGDEATHVPLVIVDPRRGGGGREVVEPVRSVDVAPTLCALAGIECAPADGRSLVPALDGTALPPRLVFAETGLWFTRDIPDVPAELRLPYPDLGELLEVVPDHDGDIVLRQRLEPLVIAAKHRMVRDQRFKLVYAPTRSGARFSLYDTTADPGETRDVRDAHPEVAARLERELWRWMLEDRGMQRQGQWLVPRVQTGAAEDDPRALSVSRGGAP